jgi:hypothetical protein
LDREGKDPFDLLEEIEKELRIDLRPLSWPISMGKTFKGVYNLYEKSLTVFNPGEKATLDNSIEIKDLNDGTLDKLIGEDLTNKLIESGLIKMEVFGAIRGRSFTNSIIIIDEFQNISKDNAKTFLTRFSDDTKVIVLGDSGQIDLKNKKDSALEPLVNKVKNRPVQGVDIVVFDKSDVVRHRLTSYFIDVFESIIADDEPKKVINTNIPKPPKDRIVKESGENIWLRKLKIFFKRTFK